VTDANATEPDRSGMSPERRARLLVVLASVLLLVASSAAGYFFGRDLAKRPLEDAHQLIHQLQPQVQKLKKQIDEQSTTLISVQTKLKRVETELSRLKPAKNTYVINSNQSLIIDDGKLTVGVVGPPNINGVTLNINGKQHHAVTGDLFAIMPDPATKCSIKVQSLDMFQVSINAVCAKAQ
jgi:hypothetical protein